MKGVPFEHHVRQINSVRTAACKVVNVLQEVNWKKWAQFLIVLHRSIVGDRWTKSLPLSFNILLQKKNIFFLKSESVPNSHQHHTAVFYSPRCEAILSQM